MLDHNAILSKTPKGLDEIEANRRALPAKLRTALVLIDGQSTVGAILARTGDHAAQFEERIEVLLLQGYLAEIEPAVEDTGRKRMNGNAASPRNSSPPSQLGPPTGTGDRSHANLSATSRLRVQDLLDETLGGNADKLAARFFACANRDDVVELLGQITAPLQKLIGPVKVARFSQKLFEILGEKT